MSFNQQVVAPNGRVYTEMEAYELSVLISEYANIAQKQGVTLAEMSNNVSQLAQLFVDVLDMRVTFPKALEAAAKENKKIDAFSVIIEGTLE